MNNELQRTAGWINWLIGFRLQELNIRWNPYAIRFSHSTYDKVEEINIQIRLLKDMIREDYKLQKERIIKERERAATRQLIKLTKKQTSS